ncbi:MAG TPA: urease accessory protein UreD [Aquabacterium sp.]|nr:urease accessory protein UreD [Aquabacterium sp.]
MSWRGQLDLHYRHDGQRTTALDRHDGPLRVLQRLYPEGDAICHHVLVHPPGGVVGGDTLTLNAQLDSGSHALITTPGATRFYKSAGGIGEQIVQASVADGARLEWLPLEAIAYPGCKGINRMRFDLAPGASMMGWDIVALGLPAANQAFEDPAWPESHFTQEIDIPGVWLERGTVGSQDHLLLDSPVGWSGNRVMATLWFARGLELDRSFSETLLEAAREKQLESTLSATSGSTQPHGQIVVTRVLAPRVEPAMALLTSIWGQWRSLAWGVPPCPPRVWRT